MIRKTCCWWFAVLFALFFSDLAQARDGDLVVPDAGMYLVNKRILYVQPNGNLRAFDGKTTRTLRKNVQMILYHKPHVYVVDRQGLHLNAQVLPLHKQAKIERLERTGKTLVLYYTYGECQKVVVTDALKITRVKWTKDTCKGFEYFWNMYVATQSISFVNSGAITYAEIYNLQTGRLWCDTRNSPEQCPDDEELLDGPTNCEDHTHDHDLPWVDALIKSIRSPDAFAWAYLCGPWQVAIRVVNYELDEKPHRLKIHFHPVRKTA